jgi:hypothetical protein
MVRIRSELSNIDDNPDACMGIFFHAGGKACFSHLLIFPSEKWSRRKSQ